MDFQTVFSFVFPKSRTKDHHEPRAGYANSYTSSVETFLSDTDAPLTLKDVEKLHHYFGHIPRKRLEDWIRKSDRLTDEVKKHLGHIELHCQSCKKNQKAKPRPVVALPRASKFNQVVVT